MKMKTLLKSNRIPSLVLGFLFFAAAGVELLAQDIRTERVRFQRGASSATIEGRITGYETVDYLLNVRAGQYMNVSMATDNRSNYFNIMEPGEEYAAIYNSSTSGNQFEGTTAKSGDYRIRVYLMRSAARRGERANYRLEMIVSGSGSSGDAMVSGTRYNATGEVACKLGYGQPTTQCPFGVVRKGNGTAEVTVTATDGSTRTIFFELGQAKRYEAQQNYGDFRASREGYLYIIEIGNERYEIPDAVISGG